MTDYRCPCGTRVNSEAAFCHKCGTRLSDGAAHQVVGLPIMDQGQNVISSYIMPANAVFVACCTVIPAILDVLSPRGPYLFIFVALLVLTTLIPFAIRKGKNSNLAGFSGLSRLMPQFTRAEFFAAKNFKWTFGVALIVVAFSAISANKKQEGGVLASLSEKIREFQTTMGIVTRNTETIIAQNEKIAKKIDDNTAILNDEVIPSQQRMHEVAEDTMALTRQTLGETKSIGTTISNVDTKVSEIDKKMDNVKQETSKDPRKELANMGLQWVDQAFGDALLRADVDVIALYMAGGWNALSNYKYGNALGHFIWRGDMSDPAKVDRIIKLLVEHGVSPTEKIVRFRGVEPLDIAEAATRTCNSTVLASILKYGGKKNLALEAVAGTKSISPVNTVTTFDQCKKNVKHIGAMLGVVLYCHHEKATFHLNNDYFNCDLDPTKPEKYWTSYDNQHRMIFHPIKE